MIAIAAVVQIQANKLAAFERHSVDAIGSEVFAFPIVLITEYKVFCTPGRAWSNMKRRNEHGTDDDRSVPGSDQGQLMKMLTEKRTPCRLDSISRDSP